MAKFELIKSVEARKLHPRTGIPTTEPLVTIPYGTVIENVTRDRDVDKFVCNLERYQVPHEILAAAIVPLDGPAAPTAAAEPAAVAAPARARTSNRPKLVWQELESTLSGCRRAKVPGGWLVAIGVTGVAFYPDPSHTWNGGSLE